MEIKEISKEQIEKLQAPMPTWAVKQHPTKTYLSVIHPMAVIDRLNEVFGMGKWNFTAEYLSCDGVKTSGGKDTYMSAVKGRLEIPDYAIIIEQFGGSTNDDKGDALKGGGTDALTKISSYLGIGAQIYKGQGNGEVPNQTTPTKTNKKAPEGSAYESAMNYIQEADSIEYLNSVNEKIVKSKILSNEEKKILTGLCVDKLQTLDPIA